MIRRRWPLIVIGASAGTATWSGWVGLGELTGFGPVRLLPGIADRFVLNTAITLPIGMEAYAVYALAVATSPRPIPTRARRWAWLSSLLALALGMAGQVSYHLLTSWGWRSAPWQIISAVSCVPVAVLAAAALLWHLTSGTEDTGAASPLAGVWSALADRIRPTAQPATTPEPAPEPAPEAPMVRDPEPDDQTDDNDVGRAALTRHAVRELTRNPAWRPKYADLQAQFQLSRPGAGKAVTAARKQIRDQEKTRRARAS